LPTYQYRCTECGHAFEQFQSFTDDALTVCPVCSGRLRKVFNAVGVVFKGSGFYRNDSRSGASAPAASSSSSTDSTSGGGDAAAPAKESGGATSGSGGTKSDSGGSTPAPSSTTSS
jgi:putative FmdB family regulatory protein